uniref:Endothiapepsin-like protein n=1 Tax=Epichloe festucae TaxID=35717 RepID=Q6UNN4_9HYPO|nr:endothiapepsin-like protein [Epichloe festucae]
MKTFPILAATLVAHVFGATVPAHGPSKRSFSLEARPKNDQRRDFASDWAAAHGRWGSSASKASLGKSALAEGEGSAGARPIVHDQAYITEVEFGTPPQKLKMILDTGSSDVFVYASQLVTQFNVEEYETGVLIFIHASWVQSSDTIYRVNDQGPWAPRYKPDSSKTARRIDKAVWGVEYPTGIVYHDTLLLGGFRVPNATIESAQIMAPRFETELAISGIMGSPNASPIISRPLRRPSSPSSGRIFTGPSSRPHWDIDLDLTAWKDDHPMWMYHRFQATIDTGTSLMFLPDPLASRYWLSIPGVQSSASPLSKAYMFPCSQADSLPDLLFKLPSTEHVLRIPGTYLNYGPINSDPSLCWGGMQSAQDMDVTVLGDVMLKAVFVAFDVDKNKIGLANKKLDDM